MMIFKFLLCVCFFSINTYSKDEHPVDLEAVIFQKEQQETNRQNIPLPTMGPVTPLIHFSQEQLWEMHHEKEYDVVYDQYKCKNWSVDDFRRAMEITRNKTNKAWFFEQWELYKFPAYWEFLKTFPDYENQLLVAYDRACEKYNHPSNWHTYCDSGLCHLNYVDGACRDIRNRRAVEEGKRQARLRHEEFVESGYQEHACELDEHIDDCYDALYLHDDYDTQSNRIERRMQAIFADEASLHFEHKEYCLSDDVKQKLWQHQAPSHEYEQCYGSALQQTIHQECIDIVDRAIHLSNDHPAYAYQDALIDLADGARELNKAGKTEKAMSVADVCWGILDCCSAVVEGAIEGAIGAVVDIYNNPLQTVASLTIGNYVMAYQALKIATNLADIGITSLIDAKAGREKWDDYIAPITNVITAVGTALAKNEISLRDAIKQGTKLVVQYKTQGKILGGLGKFYSTVKTKAINYIEKNPLATPQMYMTTPEGVMFKAVDESFCTAQRAVQPVSNIANGGTQLSKSAFKKLKKANQKNRQSIKSLIKDEKLPHKDKLRYVPPKKFDVANGLPYKYFPGTKGKKRKGFEDRFGNYWVGGDSRTEGQNFEWDVQLSSQGKQQVGWMTSDNTHLNVSLDGRVTHK